MINLTKNLAAAEGLPLHYVKVWNGQRPCVRWVGIDVTVLYDLSSSNVFFIKEPSKEVVLRREVPESYDIPQVVEEAANAFYFRRQYVEPETLKEARGAEL